MSNIPELRFKEFSGEWEEKKLGDISEDIMYGMNSSAIKYDGKHKYIRITDIDEESRKYVPSPLTSPDGEIEEKFKLKNNDILFARTGASVGKSYIYSSDDGDLYFAGFLIKFHINQVNSKFIFLLTLRNNYHKWVSVMSIRSGQPGLNAEEYKLLKIKLPSFQEQQKIALFLTTIDTKIEQLTKKVELQEQYKKGVMQKIFFGEIRFKKDNGSEFDEWEVKRLGELPIIISDGNYGELYPSSSDFQSTGVPFLRANNIKDLRINDNDMKYISEEQHAILLSGHLETNDILITTRGDLGNIALVEKNNEGSNINAQICLLRVSNMNILNYLYLLYILDYRDSKKQYQAFSTGTALKQLPKGNLKKIKLKIPSLLEQNKIADFLSTLDNQIDSTKAQLAKTKEFKKGLLQRIFI